MDGGFARNRHTEIYGTYNVGKTFITYRLIATTQEAGGVCGFVDAEATFDPEFAASAGVDLDDLALHTQEDGNRVFNVVEAWLLSGVYDVIVVDSIAALIPKSEVEVDMEASTMGTAQAKLMSTALRRLTRANKHGTALVFINQTRQAVGASVFAKQSITSGGKAMAFYAGTRLELVKTESIKRKARHIEPGTGKETKKLIVKGHRVLVRVEKDKTGAADNGSETSFVFDYELGGIDHVEDLMYLGRIHRIINLNSAGEWWVEGYSDEKQKGRNKFKKWLHRNVAVAEEVEELIRDAVKEGELVDSEAEEDDDE
jgi:recombination protein RecA